MNDSEARSSSVPYSQGLHALVEVIDGLFEKEHLLDFVEAATTLARTHLSLERLAVCLMQPDRGTLTFSTDLAGKTVDLSGRNEGFIALKKDLNLRIESQVGNAWFRFQKTEVKDSPLCASEETACDWLVLTPLRRGRQVIGFLANDHELTGRPFDPEEQELLVLYASFLSSFFREKEHQCELRRQVLRNHSLLTGIEDGLLVLDESGSIVEGNDAVCEVLGLSRAALKGRFLQEFIPSEHSIYPLFTPSDSPVILPARFDCGLINAEGSVIDFEMACKPFVDGDRRMVYLFCRDITERLQISMERKQLTEKLLDVQEKERKAMSSLLHDQLGQYLTLTRLELQAVEPANEESRDHLNASVAHVLEMLEQVRGMARALRPPTLDDLAIESALEELVEDFRHSAPHIFRFVHVSERPCNLSQEQQVALYRIVQEALQNAVRHAKADRITVRFSSEEDAVRVSVTDNGMGMQVPLNQSSRGGIGLIGIRERLEKFNGGIIIASEPGKGTKLEVMIPYELRLV